MQWALVLAIYALVVWAARVTVGLLGSLAVAAMGSDEESGLKRQQKVAPIPPPASITFDDRCAALPTELVKAQERGEVVFVCGAGVSMTAKLPSFRSLVKGIYARLHEDWTGHPAEQAAMESALDRTIFALRLRLGGQDQKAEHRVRANIISAVEDELAPQVPSEELENHFNVLRLSRDPDRRPCLVTTNFDTYFERSWKAKSGLVLPSRACADMPAPRSSDFHGVLHLHGRNQDKDLALTRTNIVLDSAEFGDAYLRTGWAARYVYDLARTVTLVFVGYSADDPPVRYLLEVLTADRARFPDLRNIYAFVDSAPNRDAQFKQSEMWKSKGTIPILYESRDIADHVALYHTLARWADYSENPKDWWTSEAKRIFALDPATLDDGNWQRVAWILTRGDGMRILAEASPHPKWAGPLYQRGLLGPSGAAPGPWVVKYLSDRTMLSALISEFRADSNLQQQIHWALETSRLTLPAVAQRAWRLLLKAWSNAHILQSFDWYSASRAIEQGDTSLEVRQVFSEHLRPVLEARVPFRWPPDRTDEDETGDHLDHWLRVDFECSPHFQFDDMLTRWPKSEDASLLLSLDRALDIALEEAADSGFDKPGYAQSSSDVPSIAPHFQNANRRGFYPLVQAIEALWLRLALSDAESAIRFARRWCESSYTLLRRLWLHTLTNPVFAPDEAGRTLMSLSDDDFWSDELRRETMRLMGQRWSEFSPAHREQLENRIAPGPPRSLFLADAEPENLRHLTLHYAFVRLVRIQATGILLGDRATVALSQIQNEFPAWELSNDDRGDFTGWVSRVTGMAGGDPNRLEGVPTEQLIERARELSQVDQFEQWHVWPLLCQADPVRALSALVAKLNQGEFAAREWSSYLWSQRNSADSELVIRTFEAMEHPTFVVAGAKEADIDFLIEQRDRILPLAGMPDRLVQVCRRAVDYVTAPDRDIDLDLEQDLLNRVLGRAEGRIVALLIKALEHRDIAGAAGFPSDLRDLFNRLAKAPGPSGIISRAAMSFNLPFLHSIDPEWGEAALVPHMTWAEPAGRAMWALFAMNDRPILVRLFHMIKPALFQGMAEPDASVDTKRGLVQRVLRMYVHSIRYPDKSIQISGIEVKNALARGGVQVLRLAASDIGHGLELEHDREASWRSWGRPLFDQVWPMDAAYHDMETTWSLVTFVFAAREEFPEAVDLVAPAMAVLDRGLLRWMHPSKGFKETSDNHPEATVGLLYAVTNRAAPPDDLGSWLDELIQLRPNLQFDQKMQALQMAVRRNSA